jgi:hypothetical protein
VPLVVDDLILVADSGVTVLSDEVLQPAVAAGADLPLEIEIERVELVARHDIPLAERVRSVVMRDAERAVSDPPTGAGRIGLPIPAPAAERRAIEQQTPPRGALSWRQRIRGRVRGRGVPDKGDHDEGEH